jgi:flavodoxin
MKILVIYDSLYGNTAKIAKAIGDAVGGEVRVLSVGEAKPSELSTVDLLFVGSPTHGGRASPPMRELLDKVQARGLGGIKVAAFDTRLTNKWARIFGFAAGRIAKSLAKKGGTLVLSPEAFYVKGTEGPLKEGELERAGAWARGIVEAASAPATH